MLARRPPGAIATTMPTIRKLRKRLKEALGLRRGRPPFTGKYYERGRQLLLDAVDIFNAARLPYLVDAGTLLGLARDGDLIPWDDDIDLVLPVEALPALRGLYGQIRQRGWQISRTYRMKMACEAWAIGDPCVVKLRSRGKLFFTPGDTQLDITVLHQHGDSYYWAVANKVCRVPRKYFDSVGYLEFGGRQVRVPQAYEEYLELNYGDWRTPKPEFHHNELGTIVQRGTKSAGTTPP